MNISKGKWWDEGIELISGCSPCSPGCEHCWSAALSHRFYREGEPGHESGIFTDASGRFSGDIMIHPERLKRFNTYDPFKRKVFAIWNDLFHEDVPNSFQQDVYFEMENRQKNIYILLSKRPKNMLKACKSFFNCDDVDIPPENIWHGLSICNQQEADKKIPIFLQVPGKKFLCIEPCLGEIDIVSFLPAILPALDRAVSGPRGDCLDAVILGCETGHGARHMNPEWAISIVRQCKAVDVPDLLPTPVFVKQIQVKGKPSKNMDEWPEELRVRELPWL